MDWRRRRQEAEERRARRESEHAEQLRAQREDFERQHAHSTGVLEPLVNDSLEAFRQADVAEVAEDKGYARRALVRALFAFYEGTLFVLRSWVLQEIEDHAFSAEEIDALRERRGWRLTENGVAKEGPPQFVRFRDGVRFTFAMIAKITGKVRADYGGEGWKRLRASEELRNGLVHPKTPSGLNVTDADMATLYGGFAWFWFTLALSLSDWKDVHGQRLAKIREEQKHDDEKMEAVQRELAENEASLETAEVSLNETTRRAIQEAFAEGYRLAKEE